jgi:hypothetical protein
VQFMEGLGSPRVGLGVNQVRTLVVVYSGRYRFAGACPPLVNSPSGTWVCEGTEVQGLKCEHQ